MSAEHKASSHRIIQHDGKLYRLAESKPVPPLRTKPYSPRDQMIREERAKGSTLREIGERHGLTKQRIAQICL